MGLSTGMAENTVYTGLDKIFFGEFNLKPGPQMASVEDSSVFRQDSVNNRGVQSEISKDGGMWTERDNELEDLTESTPRVGFAKTYEVAEFNQSLPIPRSYMEDENYGVVAEDVRKMAQKGKLTRLKEGMGVYRGAFATTKTNEGSYLVSDSHTNLNGDTVDNKLTAALAPSAIDSAIKMLIEQKDQAGDIVGCEGDTLLVPPALFPEACEIMDSVLKADTAENNMNVYSSKYGIKIKQSNYLGTAAGGSDTAWFLLARLHPVYRYVREAAHTEYTPYEYSKNWVNYYKAGYRECYGTPDYTGIVGSTGAGA